MNVFWYVPTDNLKKQNIILVSLFLLPYCHIFLRAPSEMETEPLHFCQLSSEAVHICLSGFFEDFLFIFDFLHFEHGMSRCWKTELPGSVFWCLSVIFGKFLAITTSNIYCVLLSFFSPFEIILVFQLLVCYTFWNCHTVLRQSALLLLWIYNYYIMTGGTN